MKKITLSILTITSILSAQSDIELLKSQMDEMAKKIAKLEKEKEKDNTHIISKAPKLKISGKHFLGFVSKDDKVKDDRTNKFETRRNYFQIKAYFSEESKNYFRTTFDTTKKGDGDWNVRLKYAYLYLNNILPYTGVEIGQAHRPWIDYEEHQGWWMRSVSKVFAEASEAGHLTNSADLGVNFKTKTPYFSSEIGIYNGEGYHYKEDGRGKSFEWRLTAHPLGTGKEHVKTTKSRYLDISFFGQLNQSLAKSFESDKNGTKDIEHNLNLLAGTVVYNQPNLLIAGQYVMADNEDYKYQGSGFSVNGEFRFGGKYEYALIGRYDSLDTDDDEVAKIDKDGDKNSYLIGAVYNYNKNVKFIANMLDVKYENVESKDFSQYMLTAEINW